VEIRRHFSPDIETIRNDEAKIQVDCKDAWCDQPIYVRYGKDSSAQTGHIQDFVQRCEILVATDDLGWDISMFWHAEGENNKIGF
jgi:hypothetical protein